jgi:hypothetical protein
MMVGSILVLVTKSFLVFLQVINIIIIIITIALIMILIILIEVKKAMKLKTDSQKLDAMFALTYSLNLMDCWMNDNELYGEDEELEQVITLLGMTWKQLLQKSNEELGIDGEYTRQGIEALLEKFEEKVDECECINNSFEWK